MCGFITTNKSNFDLEKTNRYIRNRGPDNTHVTSINNIKFVHNLLSITGDFTNQPICNEKGTVAAIFNGEIYNYRDIGDYKSDGYCLLDLYDRFGERFAKHIDGEFAITLFDFSKNLMILATDTFATKPIWLGVNQIDFMTCSYESALIENNFPVRIKLRPNGTFIIDLKSLSLLNQFDNKHFDLEQKKDSYEDWLNAFEGAVVKRAHLERENCFIGLSSGYDSGAISCILNKNNVEYTSYTILGAETQSIIDERKKLIKNFKIVDIDKDSFLYEKQFLQLECEDFKIDGKSTARNDKASAGLSKICRQARSENVKVYLSGQGADEILSDYGYGGYRFYGHSQFGGYFPEDLKTIFPWNSFYGGTQLKYINKEECVAGSHGIEARYPFLDYNVVQEFLWLTQGLKNKAYKAPLDYLLTKYSYPFEKNKKVGFRPNHSFKNEA